MHVFHVITTLSKGGAESHLADLTAGLAERGVRQTVAFLKGDGFWTAAMNARGIATIDLGAKRYADLAAIARLRAAIAAARPDLVHAHMPPGELYAVLALIGQDVPLVTSKHNDTEPFYRGPGAAAIERFCAGRARRVIAISQAVNDYFAAQWPARLARKLVTVRYGLSPVPGGAEAARAARGLRAEWGVGADEVLFGIVARLVEQKSIPTLLRAFAKLRAESAQPVRLVLVGHGPLEDELRALTHELGIAAAVIFAGFRTDIPAVMRALDVFVLSSIYEGFGLVLLEAMEAAVPIVASGISAIPEIVVEGETGYLVPPRDPEALAAAMAKTLPAAHRHALGEAGHARLLSAFTVARMVDQTQAVYAAALGKPA
ncbi:glycosyltransferase [Parablastomonas sp. CN1-191]|uniref:glycosyltransferase n=1 Tax=Parablastomonas sp. CN1-191 TaxID=3400908 RepID=UPI003BF8FB02